MTVTVQIGNSDDKLTQKEWSKFCERVGNSIAYHSEEVHFSGASYTKAAWQNAAWVFVISEDIAVHLKTELEKLRVEYRQNSVAWTEGATSFI